MNAKDIEDGLMSCVHCGFCLDACPTYRETGDEADSPRGRLAMMRGVFEKKLPLAEDNKGSVGYHLDRCLGCRACETACPSGVPYGRLLEQFRDDQEKVTNRSTGEKVLREGLLTVLTSPAKMKAALTAGRLTGGRIPGPVARFVGLPADTKLPLPDDLGESSRPVAEFTPAQGEKRGRVVLLTGCVMKVLYGPVHHATVKLLTANGFEVVVPQSQGCCGALHGHQGKMTGARALACDLIAELERVEADAYILNSAGCGSFLKDYGHMLKDNPHWAERAEAFAAKIKDITEFLIEVGPRPMTKPLNKTVTYHDACHLRHGQKIYDAPRQLLKAIPGINFVETVDSDLCCGSAGVYNYLQPEIAASLQKKKVENLVASKAEIVATGNPGCLAWIEQGLPSRIKIVHPVELLAAAYE
ncbi:MAG: heterodisulfide reductase-related iron-sulfur binding cluster [Armatimonas sp.]